MQADDFLAAVEERQLSELDSRAMFDNVRVPRRQTMAKTKGWTPEEDSALQNHAHEGAASVAERLGRTRSAVTVRASKLGVSLRARESSVMTTVTGCGEVVDAPEDRTAELVDTHLRLASGMVDGTAMDPTRKLALMRELDRVRELIA